MFRYVKLKNYKSLVNLNVDLCGNIDIPKKMILIYGENGVGKSNFATSFYTLLETLRTKSNKERLEQLLDDDEIKKDNISPRKLREFFKVHFKDTEVIIKNCKTVNSKENMVLEFGFKIKGKKGLYRIETDNTSIVSERLEYVYNKNQTEFFNITKQNRQLNENIFTNSDYSKEISDLIEKYWGKHSLLSLLVYEIEDKAKGYVKKRISPALFDVINYLLKLSINVKVGNRGEMGIRGISHKILANLCDGEISIKDKDELNKAEKMLNEFFTNLYSDIKQVYYQKNTKKNNIHYQLFVKKLIYNDIIDINFDLESTGTQQLMHLVPFLLNSAEGKVVILDEIDTGIHDLLVNTILENLKDSITGQLIITTHNTMLLESEIAKDYIYIFTVDKDAKKELVPLSSFEGRVHPNLNIRKRYLKGMYGGVPITMDVDFDDLVQIMK